MCESVKSLYFSPQLSKFLQHMQQEQIVQVKELSKGVESIVTVDWSHPR